MHRHKWLLASLLKNHRIKIQVHGFATCLFGAKRGGTLLIQQLLWPTSGKEEPPCGRFLILVVVVVSALQHHQVLIVSAVDQSVGLVNTPGPVACQVAHQGLWLADACKRIACSLGQ